MNFTTFFAIIVAGALVFLGQVKDVDQRLVLLALVGTSLLGLLVTVRIWAAVNVEMSKIGELAKDLDVPELADPETRGPTKMIKMRLMFPLIYLGALGVFAWLSVRGSIS